MRRDLDLTREEFEAKAKGEAGLSKITDQPKWAAGCYFADGYSGWPVSWEERSLIR